MITNRHEMGEVLFLTHLNVYIHFALAYNSVPLNSTLLLSLLELEVSV